MTPLPLKVSEEFEGIFFFFLSYAGAERGNSLESLHITIKSETTDIIICVNWLQLPKTLLSFLCFSFPFLSLV